MFICSKGEKLFQASLIRLSALNVTKQSTEYKLYRLNKNTQASHRIYFILKNFYDLTYILLV